MAKADTIAAIATAAGRAAVGIVRLSGPDLRPLFGPLLGQDPSPRSALLADFRAADGAVIDRGLALYFPGPRSYTGEDVLELHGHGSPVVLSLLLRRCLELGARAAEPGEFTRRAFLNDKLDLAQAESVADLIDASSEAAARAAMRSLRGEFSDRIQALIEQLTELRVLLEAHLDFPEEEVPPPAGPEVAGRLEDLLRELDRVAAAAASGALLREGSVVVLVGRPNVGKSSLLNYLSGEEVAIVTDIPGTTRDVIQREVTLEGVVLHVVDTAGLRPSADPIEQLGMERTRRAVQSADMALVVFDAAGLSAEDEAVLAEIPGGVSRVLVRNKIDLSGQAPGLTQGPVGVQVNVSARTGAGMDLLRQAILAAVGYQPAEEGVFLARERHLAALAAARGHVSRARETAGALELVAEELRLAQVRLSAITGAVDVEALLGQIFARFCIGK